MMFKQNQAKESSLNYNSIDSFEVPAEDLSITLKEITNLEYSALIEPNEEEKVYSIERVVDRRRKTFTVHLLKPRMNGGN